MTQLGNGKATAGVLEPGTESLHLKKKKKSQSLHAIGAYMQEQVLLSAQLKNVVKNKCLLSWVLQGGEKFTKEEGTLHRATVRAL